MIKAKNYKNYFHIVDKSKLHFVEGWTHKKEHITNTFNLYFENIGDKEIFESDEIELLKDWMTDVSKLYKSRYKDVPYSKPLQTEAIKFDDKLILKECFNLLNLISKYHEAYIIRTNYEKKIKDTIYALSSDKRRLQQTYNKFDKISKDVRKDRKYRSKFYLLKKVLNILIKDEYTKRVKQYLFFISLNFKTVNWEKMLEGEDKELQDKFFEALSFFMYFNVSEDKIKHSLMILVYTFLTKRLGLKTKDSLNLTNRLSNNILYDLDNRNDYFTRELSKDIYLNSIFHYLPIFLHYNKKNKAPYSNEEIEQLAKKLKFQASMADKRYKKHENSVFIKSYENSHIHYVLQDLIFLYNPKNE